ncbi:hypothetical protein [Deinococcus multiflagellatus]|uniref:Inward rectifier potassium channel C-terminal domain-containing protein n=1 Tax=Deinococcus multiflagellatus TaxID=1656887 RepID=A0ABW1ZI16_9DEIO
MYPVALAADALVTLEAFVGLMAVALVTGMLFARFSRPTHRLLFSRWAVVAPYQGGQGLMLRLVNGRHSNLSDVQAEVVLALREGPGPAAKRHFYPLKLERTRVTLFPLAWTVVHPLDHESPVAGLSEADLHARDAELLVVLRATDETSQQPVLARTSYQAREILFDHAFESMYVRVQGALAVDVRRLHDTRPAGAPQQN